MANYGGQEFLSALIELKTAKKINNLFSSSEYEGLMEEVKIAKKTVQKTSKQYRRVSRYDVLKIGETERLISRKSNMESDDILYFVKIEDFFEKLEEVHISTGHGGRDRMMREINKKYKNITQDVVNLYLSRCQPCMVKRKNPKKGITVKPMVFDKMNARCQVDLIDMQSLPDGEFKYIMVYQDHLTKFVILRPLKSKTAAEVSQNLLDIFLILGAPSILQSDNGKEFCAEVITVLMSMWNGLKMVHGKPRHSQSQGSVERANQDVEQMLMCWSKDNNTTKWSTGLGFVQFMKNRALHSGIKRSPYEAMFGCPAQMGLATTILPSDIVKVLQDADQLHEAREQVKDATSSIHDRNGELSHDCTTSSPVMPVEVGNNIEESVAGLICTVCEKNTPGFYTCGDCKSSIHMECGTLHETDADGVGQILLCSLCDKSKNAIDHRKRAKLSLDRQAERMVSASSKMFAAVPVGKNVTVCVPDVDRGRLDPRNILALVLETTTDGLYKLGTKEGVLKSLFSRNQFQMCDEQFFEKSEVPMDKEFSVRQAATSASVGSGQGLIKCSCTKKCVKNTCKCKRLGVLCNSRCHKNLSCLNK